MNRFRLFPCVAIAAALGACGGEVSPEISEQGGVPVECALGGESDYSSSCRLVEVADRGETYFIMRHPDGGFRRLALAETESGFEAGDGADVSESFREGDDVVLTIGSDRYRWNEPRQ